MTAAQSRQQAFRRLLTREAGAGADAVAVAAAAGRLSDVFAQQLGPLVGDAGVAAIYSRSLHLVHRQFPWLGRTQPTEQDDGRVTRVELSLRQQEAAVAAEAAVAVLATIGEVLASFIGDPLTTRLLREAWPHDFVDDVTQETTDG